MPSRPLNEVRAEDLQPLLDEEAAHWLDELRWDYAEVSSAVAGGVCRGALVGRVAFEAGRPGAYCYYMIDSGRAIVGSLFASERLRGRGVEEELLDEVLGEALGDRRQARVECQTLFSTAPGAEARFAAAGFDGRPRHYLMRDLAQPVEPPEHRFALRPLRRGDIPQAARLIHLSHEGSLDAALNLTYATPGHCRSFVETLVLRGGCGHFAPDASLVAEDAGEMVGVILASRLSETNAHVCQVSVRPDWQGSRLGGCLMRTSLAAMREAGLASVSLSVTVGNERAYALYTRLGFTLRKRFGAHAWIRSRPSRPGFV